MKVQQLLDELQGQNPDADVVFAYNYGDRCGRMVAPPVSTVLNGTVLYSEYCQEDAVHPTTEGTRDVVILTDDRMGVEEAMYE